MGEELTSGLKIALFDAAELDAWIAERGRPLTPDEQDLVDGVRAGLEDVRAGRTISHEQMLAHRAEQRRLYRAARGM